MTKEIGQNVGYEPPPECPMFCEIGPYTYKVNLSQTFAAKDEALGKHSLSELKLMVSTTDELGNILHNDRVKQIILHEIIHALNNIAGLFGCNDTKLDDQLDAFATCMLDWMRRNPYMLRWLSYKD